MAATTGSGLKEIIDYIRTGMGLCLECSGDFAPGFLIIQIALLLIGSGLSIFDTITDWNIVIQFRDQGFQNPLLPIDINWLHAWYLFAAIGTIFTAITIFHDTLDVFHSLWHSCKRCCCKSGRHYKLLQGKKESVELPSKTEDNITGGKPAERQEHGDENNHHTDHQYHLYQDGSSENSGGKDESKEDTRNKNNHTENSANSESTGTDSEDDETIEDACKCCYRFGWNFTTRAETLSFLSLWLHDFPMLTMVILYVYSQLTCKLPEREDISGEVLSVGISATASTVAASYRLTRSFVKLCISVGVRIKSKKEASKMGKWGKRCSRLLPENGDAIYPKDTCAEWCIIPYYFSLLLDFLLVGQGATIAFTIWIKYLVLKQDTNFNDSLGIYRFQADGSYVFLTNISGTIIPPSGGNTNGSYVVLETIQSRIYCLSEFQYLEKDSEIIFDTVELQPISDNGMYCATKSGYNSRDSGNYSSCTLYYGSPSSGIKILRYGFSDPTTGRTKLLENECTVLKNRLPPVEAGPRFDSDLSIQVEKNINRTYHPDATQDLRILYVSFRTSIPTVLFYISVADIVAGGLDETYFHTLQNPSNGTNTTYLIRFFYDSRTNQFTYNVKEVYNYPPRNGQRCSCSSILVGLNTIRQFVSMGSFIYGYYDPQIELFRLLRSCSIIPSHKLIPWYNFLLSVPCSSLCG